MVAPVQSNFDTCVANGTGILQLSVETSGGRYGYVDQQVLRGLLIPVEVQTQFTAQEAGVETKVNLLRCFPSQFLVLQTRERSTLGGNVLGIVERIHAVCVVCKGCLVLEGTDALVTVLSPTGTQLQEADDRRVLQEVLVADYPTCRE